MTTYKYIHLDYLETIAGDDHSLRKTLLEMVQQELSAAVPEMERAYQEQQWHNLHEIVHKLKSTLAFVGNPQLSKINQHMLSHLEQQNYNADYPGWLSEYRALTDPISAELIQELKN